MNRSHLLAMCVLLSTAALATAAEPEKFSAEDVTFFEKEVFPILRANCFSCHGGEPKVQGDFKLTSREDILKGGESGEAGATPGKPESSSLIEAINYRGLEMPPKGKLAQAQIDVLTKWVKIGLPYSAELVAKAQKRHGAPVVDDEARNFWAFRAVTRPAVPEVKNKSWVRNPVDAFILAGLESKGFTPAAPAEKASLLRRAYYAVTGLPPSPAEVESFLKDNSDGAYERAIDRLLESRQYGEHWGRHWLDLVRYAETNSFERDNPKPFVWRYRDYVIRAFNDDKPYDQFIREQLAGDELDNATAETRIATGFYRLGLWDDEPADRTLAYYDGLDDILATTSQAFLGLTLNCCRCHDHKIDPVPQKDYYSFMAFFHGVRHFDNGNGSLRSIASAEDQKKFQGQLDAHNDRIRELDQSLSEIEQIVKPHLKGGERDDFKHDNRKVDILKKYQPDTITRETFETFRDNFRERERMRRNPPKSGEQALVVTENGNRAKETFILLRGNPQSQGDKVEPAFPSVLQPADAPAIPEIRPADNNQSSGRRRVLADWIASPNNQLTYRVLVNRIWQYNFGRGLVRSSSNFGYMGSPPTHPELLDYLTTELIAGGMKLKPLHKLLLTSNTFRMGSQQSAEAKLKDPENDSYSHFDMRRLTAEEIRDSVLTVSGNINLSKSSGPSIYPLIPAEVLAGQSVPGKGWEKSSPEDAAARSVYVHIKRSLGLPILVAFDAPDPDAPCPVRFTTTQPTQALGMINGEFMHSQAKVFAEQLQKAASEPREQVRLALNRALQREPNEKEITRGLQFLKDSQETDKLPADVSLRRFCLLVLNLNEFVFVD
ncbi:PSD1 and planctomycete cytochrome C domain-containing protein [Anatilimnocola floriformis]|uniref:PSD1 and planctomycete cytochrome C domain-containing protein n=1 Tax=Anatilimnocola floriformis TaxID=2948575 RepID=UPI0020C2D26F|nr:PSD1 and planctomycete cytochrome C domain-containing protein [Anatilimnocola floriformis]